MTTPRQPIQDQRRLPTVPDNGRQQQVPDQQRRQLPEADQTVTWCPRCGHMSPPHASACYGCGNSLSR